jgi:hypothetical protein
MQAHLDLKFKKRKSQLTVRIRQWGGPCLARILADDFSLHSQPWAVQRMHALDLTRSIAN